MLANKLLAAQVPSAAGAGELQFIGSSTSKTTSTVASVAVSVPTEAQPGDLLIMSGAYSSAGGALVNFDGFTDALNSAYRFGGYLSSWDGIKDTYTFTYSVARVGILATIYVFRNAALDVFGAQSVVGALNPILPSITLSSSQNIVLAVASNLNAATVATVGFIAPVQFSLVTSEDGAGPVRQTAFSAVNMPSGPTGDITLLASSGPGSLNRGFLVGIKQA